MCRCVGRADSVVGSRCQVPSGWSGTSREPEATPAGPWVFPARAYGSLWTLGSLSRPRSTGDPRALRSPRRLLARNPKPQAECLPEHSAGKRVGSQVSPRMVAHGSAGFLLFGAHVPPPSSTPETPRFSGYSRWRRCAPLQTRAASTGGAVRSLSLPRVLRSLRTPAVFAEPLGLSRLLSPPLRRLFSASGLEDQALPSGPSGAGDSGTWEPLTVRADFSSQWCPLKHECVSF